MSSARWSGLLELYTNKYTQSMFERHAAALSKACSDAEFTGGVNPKDIETVSHIISITLSNIQTQLTSLGESEGGSNRSAVKMLVPSFIKLLRLLRRPLSASSSAFESFHVFPAFVDLLSVVGSVLFAFTYDVSVLSRESLLLDLVLETVLVLLELCDAAKSMAEKVFSKEEKGIGLTTTARRKMGTGTGTGTKTKTKTTSVADGEKLSPLDETAVLQLTTTLNIKATAGKQVPLFAANSRVGRVLTSDTLLMAALHDSHIAEDACALLVALSFPASKNSTNANDNFTGPSADASDSANASASSVASSLQFNFSGRQLEGMEKLRVNVVRLIGELSRNATVAQRICETGVVARLVDNLDVAHHDVKSQILFWSLDVVSRILDGVPRACEIIGSWHSCHVLVKLLARLLDQGYRVQEKELRNDVVVLLCVLAERYPPACVHLRDIGALHLIAVHCVSAEFQDKAASEMVQDAADTSDQSTSKAGIPRNVLVKPFTQSASNEDVEFRQWCWSFLTVIGSQSHDLDGQFYVIGPSGFLSELLMFADVSRHTIAPYSSAVTQIFRLLAFKHMSTLCDKAGASILTELGIIPSTVKAIQSVWAVASDEARPLFAATLVLLRTIASSEVSRYALVVTEDEAFSAFAQEICLPILFPMAFQNQGFRTDEHLPIISADRRECALILSSVSQSFPEEVSDLFKRQLPQACFRSLVNGLSPRPATSIEENDVLLLLVDVCWSMYPYVSELFITADGVRRLCTLLEASVDAVQRVVLSFMADIITVVGDQKKDLVVRAARDRILSWVSPLSKRTAVQILLSHWTAQEKRVPMRTFEANPDKIQQRLRQKALVNHLLEQLQTPRSRTVTIQSEAFVPQPSAAVTAPSSSNNRRRGEVEDEEISQISSSDIDEDGSDAASTSAGNRNENRKSRNNDHFVFIDVAQRNDEEFDSAQDFDDVVVDELNAGHLLSTDAMLEKNTNSNAAGSAMPSGENSGTENLVPSKELQVAERDAEKIRLKLYSLLCMLGFPEESLDRSEVLLLRRVKKYVVLREAETWQDIFFELKYANIKPISEDREALQSLEKSLSGILSSMSAEQGAQNAEWADHDLIQEAYFYKQISRSEETGRLARSLLKSEKKTSIVEAKKKQNEAAGIKRVYKDAYYDESSEDEDDKNVRETLQTSQSLSARTHPDGHGHGPLEQATKPVQPPQLGARTVTPTASVKMQDDTSEGEKKERSKRIEIAAHNEYISKTILNDADLSASLKRFEKKR
eukprot:ANDGO_00967.mRNA.1 hypothetical protein